MNEKIYKVMGGAGALNIAFGVISIVFFHFLYKMNCWFRQIKALSVMDSNVIKLRFDSQISV